ncbi:hypothetical protein DFJ73DRAFT_824352, partial [Zopfochytrium polystomum]
NDVLDAILDRLQILDLLAVSHVCSALRQSVDHDNGHRWRLAVFRRYYAGRTFRASLPERQWLVPVPANQFSCSRSPNTHEWLPADMCGRPGGCETYRKTIDDPYLPAAQVTSYVVHAAAAVGSGETRGDAMPAAGSRVRTSHQVAARLSGLGFPSHATRMLTQLPPHAGLWQHRHRDVFRHAGEQNDARKHATRRRDVQIVSKIRSAPSTLGCRSEWVEGVCSGSVCVHRSRGATGYAAPPQVARKA